MAQPVRNHSESPFRQLHNGGGVFGGGHAGFFFELSGKIVDGGISKDIGNLCNIHLPGPDQLFGMINLQADETLHNAAPGFFPEQLF